MKTDLEYLYLELSKQYGGACALNLNSPQSAFVGEIEPLPTNGEFSPHSLYLLDDGADIPASAASLNILYLSDRRPDIKSPHNILWCKPMVPLETVRSLHRELRDLRIRFESISTQLINQLYSGGGPTAIANLGYQLLGGPISIIDTSYKLVACTDSYFSMNAFTERTLCLGYIPQENLQRLQEQKRFETLHKITSPVFIPNEHLDEVPAPRLGWYDISIRLHNATIAYMSLLADTHLLSDFELDCFAFLAKLVSIELQRSETFVATHGLAYESLLDDILSSRLTDRTTIEARFRGLHICLGPALYVAVAVLREPVHQNSGPKIPGKTQTILRSLIGGCMSISYQSRVIFLINRKEGDALFTQQDSLEEILLSNGLILSISNRFQEIEAMPHYYEQALKALEFGQRSNPSAPLQFYSAIASYHAYELLQQHIPLKDLCHPLVLSLYEKNDENSRDLLTTLKCYLSSNKNVSKVTKELHIHQSTLFYRINKIKSMMGGSFDDDRTTFHLLFSLDIIQYFYLFAS